jgi:4-amino-4-deoxy-L-arabinose transferase-like glycosyltransferase
VSTSLDAAVRAHDASPLAALGARWQRLAIPMVLLLAVVVFAVPAGRRPFWSSDEARFAVLAQDILDHGRWLVPHLRGDLYLNKPQLYFWSIALVSLPAGRVTELTAAIPSVASAVATVAAVVMIGRLLWGPLVGLLAGLILIATPPFFVFSHAVLSDVMMTAFMTWALYFLLRSQADDGGTGHLFAFYGCIAAAVLAKGPAGLAALAAGLVAIAVTRGPTALTRLRPLAGLVVFAAVGVVWFMPYLVQSQGRFVSRVLVGHYTTWYMDGGLLPRLGQGVALLANFLPWTVMLAAAVLWWRRHPDQDRRWIGTVAIVLTVVLGLAGHQRARYLLPIYPWLALLVAEFVGRAVLKGGGRALQLGSGVVAALLAAGALAVPVLSHLVTGDDRAYLPDGAIELSVVVILLLGAALSLAIATWRRAFVAGIVATAGILAVVMILEGVTYPRRYARDNDVRPLAQAVIRHTPPGSPVIVYPDARLSLDFYVGRPIIEATTRDGAAALMAKSSSALVTPRTHWLALAPLLPPSSRVVTTGQAGGREYVVVVP